MYENQYNRKWIVENAEKILSNYTEGITLRQLHYRLVAIGMTNDVNHYKRVINAMTQCRWNGSIGFKEFIDRDRSVYGTTKIEETNVEDEIESAKETIKLWMEAYYKNRWENQDNFIEVWIEKKALQGVFETTCSRNRVALCPCKGYPSLTYLDNAFDRFENAIDLNKKITILYFGDYDPSGSNIPYTIKQNIERMGMNIKIERIALNPNQIKEMNLPSVPPKKTDTRTLNWDGNSCVECDAVEPSILAKMCHDQINKYFNKEKHKELLLTQEKEKKIYQEKLKEFVKELGKED